MILICESYGAKLPVYIMFCSESKEHNTYCKHCVMATNTVYAWYTVKLYNPPPQKKKIKIGGRTPGAPVLAFGIGNISAI